MSLKSRAALVLGVIALTVGSFAPTALADSGGLDTGFGTGGSTVLHSNTTVSQSIKTADGGVAIAGTIGAAAPHNAYVAKLTASGSLDAAFGTGGILIVDAGGDDFGLGISQRTNGGFVVSGSSDPDFSAPDAPAFIAMTTSSGALDTTWSADGLAQMDLGGSLITTDWLASVDRAFEIPSGEVVYAGARDDSGQPVYGTTDQNGNWNVRSGYVNFTYGAPTVVDLFPRSDGLSELVSTSTNGAGITQIIVTVFNENVDGGGGANTPNFEVPTLVNAYATVRRGYLSATNVLTLLGGSAAGAADPHRGVVWQFDATGVADATFGTGGTVLLPVAADGWDAVGMSRDSVGKIYISGDLGTDRVRTIRLNSNFTLDPSFGESAGIADRTYGSAPNRVNNVFVDGSDRPVATGTFNTSGAAWRIERFDYASTLLGEVTYSPSFVQRLNTVNFSYSVKNNGPDASDVVIDIDVPAQFESQNYSTSFGSVAVAADGTGGTWTIPQLAAGSTATLTLSGKPGEVGMLKTTATILSQSANRVGAAATPMSTQVMVYGAATPRDDVIYGTPRKDIIDALTGDDVVFALAGNDIIDGNEGNDKIYGQVGDDIVRGNNGNDLVDGGAGNDTALGGAGTDRVLGGSGNDAVDGGAGNDVVDGGSGNDKVAGGSGNDLLYGRTGNDRLNSGDGNDKVFAGQGNDTVFGGAGADKLYGEGGNDYLIAQGSGDQLFGGPGRDRLDGGADADRIFGGTGDDWINGKTGNDIMNGNTGNDWIRVFAGNDRLIGGGGDDLLNGGSGKDVFSAGSGDDIIRADDAFGGDVINCGVGWDLVYANPGDSIDSNCEYVKFDVPAGTRYSGDRGSNAPAQWAQRVRRG